MPESFINSIRKIAAIPDNEVAKILENASLKELRKGENFINEGQVPRKFGFNLKGFFRYYYIDTKGNEYTKGFFPENTFISSYSAMIQNRGSHFTIEALENSSLLVIDYQKWMQLTKEHICWTKLLLALIEQGYCKKEARERELLIFDAETRYRNFLAEFPDLDQRIKQHMVASYLGITSVALSRIRKKMGLINIG